MPNENHDIALDEITLQLYLENKLAPETRRAVRRQIDHSRASWEVWQRFRWAKAQGRPEYKELQAYYGDQFVEYFDSSWALAEEWNRRNPQTPQEVEQFYQEVPYYVYNLSIWEASGHRPKYVLNALSSLEKHQSQYILDFGCGIGTDGLKLIEHGYQILFYDFANHSTEFLRWRLAKRQIAANIYHPPFNPTTVPLFDTLWAMDVIEHLTEPEQQLGPLLNRARVFIFDTEDPAQANGRHPFHITTPSFIQTFLENYQFRRDESIDTINVWVKETPSAM